jgi:hypothetical protein
MIPQSKRHLYFRSMSSSQALTQSVFAGLAAVNRLDALAGLSAEDGSPAFFERAAGYAMELEHRVSNLHERIATSIDALFVGPTNIAVEVKFAEHEFGRCSRTRLAVDHRNYCDGSYAIQRERRERCSLSEGGIRYWEFIPDLFDWSRDQDHLSCPLEFTYQLARTVLAACVGKDGANTENVHALVVYDDRNPAFSPGGRADVQWQKATCGLRNPRVLRRVSWQTLARRLEQFRDLEWLTTALAAKYGIRGEVVA